MINQIAGQAALLLAIPFFLIIIILGIIRYRKLERYYIWPAAIIAILALVARFYPTNL